MRTIQDKFDKDLNLLDFYTKTVLPLQVNPLNKDLDPSMILYRGARGGVFH